MAHWPTIVALLVAGGAYAGHEAMFPITKEKELCNGSESKACRYLGVEERCGLQAPPPLLARTNATPCPNGDPAGCLPNGFGGWYHPDHGGVITLPEGNSLWFEHEALHHLLCVTRGDCWSHDAPEWGCESRQ